MSAGVEIEVKVANTDAEITTDSDFRSRGFISPRSSVQESLAIEQNGG